MEALRNGKEGPGLSPRERYMLAYAKQLTLAPASASETDIEILRRLGFSDRGVLEINLSAAYMNFVNRVALGLGVESEESMTPFTR